MPTYTVTGIFLFDSITEFDGIFVYTNDLATLQSGQWLSDPIVDVLLW